VIALLDGRVAVTHAGLDAASASRNHVAFLRAHLVSCGVLDDRDEHSASFARWHQQAVAQIAPGADRAHVQAFARWQIAHDLARARPLERTAASTQKHSRCKVRQAIALTEWLHHQNLALTDLRQDLLDAWVTQGASTRRTVRLFVAWLARAGVTARLDVAWNRRGPRPASLDERDRLAALRRLLEDESADPRDRLAGCLLLLYGQPSTRTAALRCTDITDVRGRASIRLGRGTLPLPPPMDTIARLVLETQPPTKDGWLCPGRHPGTHLTAEHLRVRVARYGLASITSRSSAILGARRATPRARARRATRDPPKPRRSMGADRRPGLRQLRRHTPRAHAAPLSNSHTRQRNRTLLTGR
jgi:hypothetical protein